MFRLTTLALALGVSSSALADPLSTILKDGTVSGNVDLRYENVAQDNALDDANAFTVRTRIAFKTGAYEGWSALVEMEDNRIVLGQGDYSVPPTGYQTGVHSVIADPEHTELDQGFIQYTGDAITFKLGRQVIVHDGQRHIGHVGWRHDRQTFDGASVVFQAESGLKAQYQFIDQRNRIFAEAADIDSEDHLFNLSYPTTVGNLSAYRYMLKTPTSTTNGIDTTGVRLAGKQAHGENTFMYQLEFAQQKNTSGETNIESHYTLVELGYNVNGITAKVGYELLGSDDGAGAFASPLATLHKFNGWSDQFLGTPAEGLMDVYAVVAGKALGGNWLLKYHDFSADEATSTVDDLGTELNVQYVKKVSNTTKIGVKYANYEAGDIKFDTDKLWVWANVSF